MSAKRYTKRDPMGPPREPNRKLPCPDCGGVVAAAAFWPGVERVGDVVLDGMHLMMECVGCGQVFGPLTFAAREGPRVVTLTPNEDRLEAMLDE